MIVRVPKPRFYICLFFLCVILVVILSFHSKLPKRETDDYRWNIPHGKTANEKQPHFDNKLLWVGEGEAGVRRHRKNGLHQSKMNVGPNIKAGEVIPMYVVEEHHAVIPYWYEAVEKGILPHRTGNTLIHIDAHSDFGNPNIGSSFPLFRWPNKHEWPLLMQENDMFIVAAALTGMFSRMVWVYPDWDMSIMKESGFYSTHVIMNVSVGIEIPNIDSPKYDPTNPSRVCACVRFLNMPIKNSHKTTTSDGKDCVALMNITSESEDEPISWSNCRLLNKSARLEAVKESKLFELLQHRDPSFQPIRPTDGWILDIDEDYFGVEAPVLPLYKSNLTDVWIDNLSGRISGIFCAETGAEEIMGDLVFQKLIKFIRFGDGGYKDDCVMWKKWIALKRDYDSTSSEKEVSHFQVGCARTVLKLLMAGNIARSDKFPGTKTSGSSSENVLCPQYDESARVVFMGKLLAMLYRMKDTQLQALADVGICMWSSIPTGDMPGRMKVCDGFNRPNGDSSVVFHMPTIGLIRSQGLRLKKFLEGLSESFSSAPTAPGHNKPLVAPHLITLARSARDGYVPRSLFSRIETSIIKSARDVFQKVKPLTVVYDSDLFGGVTGWNTRHRETTTEG